VNGGSVFTLQNLPPSFRTHPHRTHPESSFSVAEKALESLSSQTIEMESLVISLRYVLELEFKNVQSISVTE
jgi:hypothetical protein